MRLVPLLILSLAPASAALQDGACRLHGRLVDTAGEPVSGARLELHGWGANSQRIQRYGLPEDWKDAAVESGEDGTFELSFVPPRAFQFTLKVEHEDYGKIGWRWSELVPESVTDLGDSVLEAPAVLTGYLVDDDGNLLVEGWSVSAWHSWGSRVENRSTQGSYVVPNPETGTFRIDDLPPGRLRVSAKSAAGAQIESRWIETKPGEETQVELEYDGPDLTRRLLLTIFSRPFYTFRPDPGTVVALGAAGERIPLEPAPGRANDWHAVDVEPGVYAIEIDDPRFRVWRKEGIRTGTRASASLVGSASLKLDVRRPDSEGPADRFGVRVTYRNVNFSPNSFIVIEDGADVPGGGLVRGIVPGDDIEIEIRLEGYPPLHVAVGELAPGETRDLSLSPEDAKSLRGRVLHADGKPASGVRVQITRGDVHGHDLGPGTTSSMSNFVDGERRTFTIRYRDDETLTGDDGAFRFDGLPTGKHAVRAIASTWSSIDVIVDVGPEAEEILTLPPLGNLVVSIALGEGVDPEGYTLQPIAYGASSRLRVPHFGVQGEPLDAEGRCHLVGLPVGEVRLMLNVPSGEGSWSGQGLGTADVEAGVETELSFDVRDSIPVEGTVEVRVGGRPIAGPQVQLEPADGRRPSGLGTFVENGRTVHRAPPGRYRVLVEDPSSRWTWIGPEDLVVRSGEPFHLVVDVPLVERALELVDETGAPWANASVRCHGEHRSPAASDLRTDADGRVTLTLPKGEYEVECGPRLEGVEVSWTAGEGALRVVVPRRGG